ncbi:hypothetical protein QQ045_023593 [Rhodiola kirilowii]
MARKTATVDDYSTPPPKRPIHISDRKRKKNPRVKIPANEVPAKDQHDRTRKHIPYQTSTQTLKVGGYPSYTKGNKEVIDTNTSELRKKPVGAKKAPKRIRKR